ncbi:MAG: disulfide isomerase DsbC N-terminal domain-containing protein, partial [Candidatus Competibacteraceae bacterium]
MRKILLVAVVWFATGALASEPAPPAPAESAPARQPDLARMQATLNGAQPDSIAPTPIPGLYEIVLAGQVLYLSADGRFVVQGEILDLDTRTNLTDDRRGELRGKAIEAVGEDKMVIFAPEGPVKHTVLLPRPGGRNYANHRHERIGAHQGGVRAGPHKAPQEAV